MTEVCSLKVSILFALLNNAPPLDILPSPKHQLAETGSAGGLSENKMSKGPLRKGFCSHTLLFPVKYSQPLQEEEEEDERGRGSSLV